MATSLLELSNLYIESKIPFSVFGLNMARSRACQSAVHGGQPLVDL